MKNSKRHNWRHLTIMLVLFSGLFIFPGCDDDDELDGEPIACFEYNIIDSSHGTVQFYNCSENANSYYWDFGGGQTSTKENPNHVFSGDAPHPVTLIAYNGYEPDTLTRLVYDYVMVYKPNIYLYPQEELDICLDVSFPMGGEITASIPEYGNQWCVTVDTDGKIDGEYDFLFYESSQPNIFQHEKGWCVKQSELTAFFETNLEAYNFAPAEIDDFLECWIPQLSENEYYLIYPQTNEIIDQVIAFDFSVNPNHINRLFYGFKGTDEFTTLEEPEIVSFARDGFTVMEWGGFWK
ncbi:PKD domain-containing protein [Draconibacterium sp. IB214405]|uniref:PKD domain-containing protein n=1 Tax=Draconibacterium sp. IB214405 TaxID=3097352 RepID=UPI002A1836CC|nr:PKD domain-containing protein [Draconibacterium sp. IB214405]MDX8340942.1 PKD domain-containing protein [Draconibacterium sp. IB214405]